MKKRIITSAKNYFYEFKPALYDSLFIIIAIISIGYYFQIVDAAELLYNFSRAHENYNLDEILLLIAISPIFLFIFILRRFIELKQLMDIANTDPLIGILNRRKGSEIILEELTYLEKNKKASIIMFDLDNFKNINDSFGHDMGDTILKEIVLIIQNSMRSDDTLIRWGGEEFIILCQDTSLESCFNLAERFRKNIQEAKFSTQTQITASFGVIELEKDLSLREQIKNVDEKLYKSKNEGKNRIT